MMKSNIYEENIYCPQNFKKNTLKNKLVHLCPYCDYSTTYIAIMKRHIRKHTGEKPFKCLVCGKKFSRKDHMQNHMIIHGFN
ncbi:UNVERIFIED_CONTAM: zinc finger and BTB domain-containing protein 46 [Trichonephila clavipes]